MTFDYLRYDVLIKAKILLLWFLLLTVCLPLSFYGQQSESAFHDIHQKEYWKSYLTDTRDILVSPATWDAGDWGKFGGLVAAGALVYVYDNEVYDLIQRNKSDESGWISRNIAEPVGSGLYTLPVLGLFYACGAVKHDDHKKNIALTGLKAFTLGLGASVVAKHIFHRHRPCQNDPPDPRRWEGPFTGNWQKDAFPSSHTTVAFAVASAIAAGYPEKKWIGVAGYSLAALAGWSRIHDRKHWPSDVFAGAVLGTYIGVFVSRSNLTSTRTGLTFVQGIPVFSVAYSLN